VSKKVLIQKRIFLLPDRYINLNISKIDNIKISNNVIGKGLITSTALMSLTFEYKDAEKLMCDASLAYKWTTLKFEDDYQLEHIIVKCNRV
jgi:hypothetical protein